MRSIAFTGKQDGITLIGFVLVLLVVSFFAFMAMRLVPVYSEYYSVVKAMKSVGSDSNNGNDNIAALQTALQRHFDVGYVETVKGKDAKLIHADSGNQLNMNYEVRRPFIYNIDFVVKFDYTVDLNRTNAGG